MKMPLVELKYLLKNSCAKETSDAPDQWTPENPFFGHCGVIACVVQDFLGGKIRRSLFPQEWALKFGSKSHYWNDVPNGFGGIDWVDLSKNQFPPDFPWKSFIQGSIGEMSENKDWREYVLSFRKTRDRYDLLMMKLHGQHFSNPLFIDEKFQKCWELAFSGESKCPKMRFACLVYDGDKLIASGTNKNFITPFGKERLCSADGSTCIRMGMPSRTDATLGDCGHAPIWCLKQVFDLGYKPADLKKLDFYEGGFNIDGSPWWRTEPSYSCTYCQNMFAMFGLDKIYGAFGGSWQPLWTKDSLYSSVEYAKGEKKV